MCVPIVKWVRMSHTRQGLPSRLWSCNGGTLYLCLSSLINPSSLQEKGLEMIEKGFKKNKLLVDCSVFSSKGDSISNQWRQRRLGQGNTSKMKLKRQEWDPVIIKERQLTHYEVKDSVKRVETAKFLIIPHTHSYYNHIIVNNFKCMNIIIAINYYYSLLYWFKQ